MFSDLADPGAAPSAEAASLLFGTSEEKNKRLCKLTNNLDVLEDITSIVKSARLTKAKGRAAANRFQVPTNQPGAKLMKSCRHEVY